MGFQPLTLEVYIHFHWSMLFVYFSDDLPKAKLKMSVADSLKKALVKLKEKEKDKPAKSDGKWSFYYFI